MPVKLLAQDDCDLPTRSREKQTFFSKEESDDFSRGKVDMIYLHTWISLSARQRTEHFHARFNG
jgi:hypothetical protein